LSRRGEFRSTGVQEYRSTGVQEFRSSGVQEFRSQESGVAEYRSGSPFGLYCARIGNKQFGDLFQKMLDLTQPQFKGSVCWHTGGTDGVNSDKTVTSPAHLDTNSSFVYLVKDAWRKARRTTPPCAFSKQWWELYQLSDCGLASRLSLRNRELGEDLLTPDS
jgi:hypothetical protein